MVGAGLAQALGMRYLYVYSRLCAIGFDMQHGAQGTIFPKHILRCRMGCSRQVFARYKLLILQAPTPGPQLSEPALLTDRQS